MGTTLTPNLLKKLYWGKELSLNQIGNKFELCSGTILHWMKRYDIPRRTFETKFPKNLLFDLYINRKLSSLKIAKMLKTDSRYVRKRLAFYKIPRRTLSETSRKYPKTSFNNDLCLQAYMLGLRTGDFHAKRAHQQIRVQTTTTHPAQIEMAKRTFGTFSHVGVHEFFNRGFNAKQWFVYCDLDKSFEFLLEKPKEIPNWILNDELLFLNFLAGYADCEGSWRIAKSHKRSIRFMFQIGAQDKDVLYQIFNNLNKLSYYSNIYLDKEKGIDKRGKKNNADLYRVVVYRTEDVIRLANILLPLSRHQEKIDKIKLLLQSKGKNWNYVGPAVIKIRNKIKKERLN